MFVVYFLIALILLVGAFIAGLKLSDYYHWQAHEWEQYALRKQYARIKAGVDADDSGQPYVAPPSTRRNPIPSSFVDHLRKNGAATIQLDNRQPENPGASAGTIL